MNDNTSEQKLSFSSGNPKLQSTLQEKLKNKAQQPGSKLQYEYAENIYSNPLLVQVQRRVIKEMNPNLIASLKDEMDLHDAIEVLLYSIGEAEFPTLSKKEISLIVKSIIDEFTGLGPLQKLIFDNTVSEVMVNGYNQVYVERSGRLELTEVRFRDNDHVNQIIDKIVAPLGRRIDESSPMVDARLPNGSRVNAIISPVSIKGPIITIRKFAESPLTMSCLIKNKSLDEKMALFLKMSVLSKANIIVAGGTGSGKTTFLNILSSYIPSGERIITIEDAAELQLNQNHIISLESRPPNIEGKGEVTIRDLVRNSLRMRPDRIVIGEVRGAETLDMLQAMNTGHNGSLSTVHANSPRDALSRLETMVLYTGIDFPIRAIREQICSALDLIIYIERLPDGTRKVTQITELSGLEGDVYVLQDVFYFEKMGLSNGKMRGEFKSTPFRPNIYEKFESMGITANGMRGLK